MRKNIRILVGLVLLSSQFIGCQQPLSQEPPVARIQNVIEEYYRVKVDDPYRYMENLKDPEVQSWIKGQAEYAADVLGKIPGRNVLLERLKELGRDVEAYLRD